MQRMPGMLAVAVAATSAAIASSPAAQAPGGGRNLPVLPVSLWQAETRPGDTVALEEKEGCLVVRFDLNVDSVYQQGHVANKQARARILLRQPVALGSGEVRLILEALGMQKPPHALARVQITPLIRDNRGEILQYYLHAVPHLRAGTANWAQWMTRAFAVSEAGGAQQDIFDSVGGEARNAWPDGALTLIGFDVLARAPEFGRQKGELAVASIRTGGVRVLAEEPFAYADGLLAQAGAYAFALRVTGEFQGAPLHESVTPVTYDPASLQSRRQRLTFPLGPDGDYWMTYQVRDAEGGVVTNGSFRTRVEDSPNPAPLRPVSLAQEPSIGYVRINPDRRAGAVYTPPEALKVTVRVFAKGAPALSLAWRLTPYATKALIQHGTNEVSFGGAAFRDVTLALSGEDGRDAYRLRLEVLREGRRVDEQDCLLGWATDFVNPPPRRAGAVLNRAYVKQSSYFRVTYTVPEAGPPASEDEAVAVFEKFLDQASQMTRYLTYMVALEDFEVLPGVYDFVLLDRLMDAAADRGCALTIRLGVHFRPDRRDFTFIPYSRQRSFDGSPILQHIYGGGFSLTDDGYVAAWRRAFRAVATRYGNHPGFQGYYLLQPCGEGTVFDKPWEGQIAGYERSSLDRFRRYLRDEKRLSLAALNARWGTQHTSWDLVRPPLPDFSLGKAPDLRMSWLDFNLFKVGLESSWFRDCATTIRSYDTNHVLIAYGGADSIADTPPGLIDYLHNGGNHFLQDEGKYVPLWEGDTGWISEPHHPHGWAAYGDPQERGWVLDWTVYVMTAQAGGGGANLHVYYVPWTNPSGDPWYLPAHYGRWYGYDRFEVYKPILRELYGLKLAEPPRQVGVLHDPYSLYCKHRTTFSPRLQDLRRWFELLKLDAVGYEDIREERLGQYRLVVPNALDEVMSDANIRLLDRAVREHGARMVMTAIAGKYCPERGPEPFPLLRQLGIAPPSGAYVLGETNVWAEATEDHALFAKGSRLKMFTLADQQQALQSDLVRIRENFWSWAFRWIPQTDYFGYYRDHPAADGKVLARFASGGAALSRHAVGKGEVLVFWGMPDYQPALYTGMMARAAAWAGVADPRKGSPVPYTLEGDNAKLGRHYALMCQETPGTYRQKLPAVPDGDWFLDDMVGQQRLGTYTGAELRDPGLELTFAPGCSPLKVVRMAPAKTMNAEWVRKYRQPAAAAP